MKRLKQFMLLLSLLLLSFQTYAIRKVVYGTDDRLDLLDVANPLHAHLARSTAAMISPSKLKNTNHGTYKVEADLLQSGGICSSERFATQTTAARCSGFLLADNILVTAGHCVRSVSDCTNYKWVFDYYQSSNMEIPEDSVYSCTQIIKTVLDGSTQNDFAIIKLDRSVTDRDALEYRKSGAVQAGDHLVVIGHPSGLPTKVAANAVVRTASDPFFFVANLDTFGGNSGSAVFNSETGLVEGILVRGESDYKYDYSKGCQVVNTCTDGGCRGEDVTRITNLVEILGQYDDVGDLQTVTVEKKSIDLAIADLKTTTYSFEVDLIDSIEEANIYVDIAHTYSGDLVLTLITPFGEKIVLRSRKGGGTDNVRETYSLNQLKEKSAKGTWTLEIEDKAYYDIGKLKELKLVVTGH